MACSRMSIVAISTAGLLQVVLTICSKYDSDNLQPACRSQLAASLPFAICSKSAVRNLQQVCRSQLAASLLTTCSRLVVIKLEQAMRTHPDIGLMTATCSKSAAGLLQLARFWLCTDICKKCGQQSPRKQNWSHQWVQCDLCDGWYHLYIYIIYTL